MEKIKNNKNVIICCFIILILCLILYFLRGPIFMNVQATGLIVNMVICIAAILALYQIVVAKKTAENNSKRESIKLAGEMVRLYLGEYVTLSNKSFNYENKHNIKPLEAPTRIENFYLKEFADKGYTKIVREAFAQHMNVSDNHKELSSLLLEEMNYLQIFATPFIGGVADDMVAFQSVGRSFCSSMERLWFEFAILRTPKRGAYDYFSNCTSLYKIWKQRLLKYELELSRSDLEGKIKALEAK